MVSISLSALVLMMIVSVLRSGRAQIATIVDTSKCFFQTNYYDCLDADEHCAWCTDELYEMRKYRCMHEEKLLASNCSASKILTNDNYHSIETLLNEPHRDFDEKMQAIQISPQKVRFVLGKLAARTVTVTYKPAKNYPLDMYYLMDLTWSMRDDKANLEKMGSQLALALANLTANYRLGFGSFADKPAMPFIQSEPHRLANPCYSENEQCEPTYGFRHRLRISSDINSFIEQVKQSNVTGNIDNLEAGLDALMQVLVCEKQIGWGSNTRKIVIIATDGLLHMAGDGLLAGIVRDNDKQCHLSEDGSFIQEVQYDYPSLEQIWRVLEKTKTAVIFAVTDEKQTYYKRLSELIPEFTSVGQLQDDSSNIIQLVKDGYREFVNRIMFTDDAPDYIQLKYFTDCGGMYETPQPLYRCSNIETGNEYKIDVEVRLLDYPKDPSITELTVRIEEKLISNEAIELQIQFRSNCPNHKMVASDLCNYQGDFVCGLCQCYTGWIGKTCECNLQNSLNRKELLKQCVAPSSMDDLGDEVTCSDRGECLCGQCFCEAPFDGEYCECTSCTELNGVICGGPERGICVCGKCSCYNSWTGDNCDCSMDTSTCKAPLGDEICSGHGTCDCGICHCNELFHGNYCETKYGEQSPMCLSFEECVRCEVQEKNSEPCQNKEARCRQKEYFYQVEFSNNVDESHQCVFRYKIDERVCDYNYSYESIGKHQTLIKIRDVKCEEVKSAAIYVSIIVLIVFATGMIIVLGYRLKTWREDKAIFAKFEKERAHETEYRELSPIYRSPISSFQVPPEMEATVL
ncbi:integrin beta-nu-like isoform X1 [Anopheles albimanus]|uniref:Integrin beta n=2 Tax=Anopheles albimanus TaxID=7167 RepID=A0A8W7K948_ANOAL|nr:integrin beta-nu-like isoform X1 [Anopheles albimanus]